MVEKKSTKVREDKKTSIKLDTWNVFQKKKKLDKWISIRVMDKSVNKIQSIQLNYIQNIRFVCIQIIQKKIIINKKKKKIEANFQKKKIIQNS